MRSCERSIGACVSFKTSSTREAGEEEEEEEEARNSWGVRLSQTEMSLF
jgi:hypothetical protein